MERTASRGLHYNSVFDCINEVKRPCRKPIRISFWISANEKVPITVTIDKITLLLYEIHVWRLYVFEIDFRLI